MTRVQREASMYRSRAIDEWMTNHPFSTRANAEKEIDNEVKELNDEVDAATEKSQYVQKKCSLKTCQFIGKTKADVVFHENKFGHVRRYD